MDLTKLFKWTSEITIVDGKGEPVMSGKTPLVLYLQVIGDADLSHARKQALKASKILRRELRDKESDNHAAMLPDYENLEEKALYNMIILAESLELRRAAMETAKRPKEPKKPKSDANLEQQEKYETALEDFDTKVTELINERTTELVEIRKNELKGRSKEELVTIFVESTIGSLCQAEMLRTFNSWCAYLGTFLDKKRTKRGFNSFKDYENAAPELKSQIVSGYFQLEMGGEDLKN